jgi:hypothetical protein
MFVNRGHPNSTRITPSKGDGGVDILDLGAGPGGSDMVYQVKALYGTTRFNREGRSRKVT